MRAFEWTKILASILTALIVAMVSGILAEHLYRTAKPAKPAFVVASARHAAPQPGPPRAPKSIVPLLAKADVKKGESLTTVCQICHTFNKGGPNKIGPNLYGVYGGAIAEDRGGFDFSSALAKYKGIWTPDLLNVWLTDPAKFAPGTKMTFAGIPSEKQRVDIIAYLRSLGGKPVPIAKAAPPSAPSAKGPAGFAALLAKASPQKGKSAAVVCGICHTLNKGGPNKIGPNLYGIVGSKVAEDRGGFAFSAALKKHKGVWTPELLNEWLKDPAKFAPGTKMAFAGIPSEQKRADIISYLETLGGKPKAAAKAPAPAPAKKAASGFSALVEKASVEQGKSAAVVCGICHTLNKGGPNKIGPNLYGILGAKIAEDRGGFAFSAALKKKKGVWTLELLNEWLTDPAKFAPGTKMAFAGIPSEQKRAQIVAYLKSLK